MCPYFILLGTGKRPTWVKPTPVVKAAWHDAPHIRQIERGSSVADAPSGADHCEQVGVLGAAHGTAVTDQVVAGELGEVLVTHELHDADTGLGLSLKRLEAIVQVLEGGIDPQLL